jgi:cytochrome c-type biogenesis protein CcmF
VFSEAADGTVVTVGRPFYDRVNGPILLLIVVLMGIGPLLPWRRSTTQSLIRALRAPLIAALLTLVVLLIVGVRQPVALVAFASVCLAVGGILSEWLRGTRSRHRRGEAYPAAFFNLLAGNRPRYGGYIVHLSVIMVALGIVGTSFFNTQKDIVLEPGERTSVADYELLYLGTTERTFGNRTEFSSAVEVYRDGELIDTLRPNRAFYPNFNMASTRAAIRSSPVEDLYVVPSENLPDGNVGFRILVNPLIWWMWVAGPVLVLGTVIALWPQPSRVPVPARAAAGAARPTAA